jgi:hypothetical protein
MEWEEVTREGGMRSAGPGHSPDRREHGVLKDISTVQKQENASDHDLRTRKKNCSSICLINKLHRSRLFGLCYASCLKNNVIIS